MKEIRTLEEQVKTLQSWIDRAQSICFFTGAGVSTESGIPDFRSQNGLYKKNLSFVDVVSRPYFERDPNQFWPLFKEIFRIKLLHEYKPNKGHEFIAELESRGKQVRVITQNIDGLHQEAGNKYVYEIHGTIKYAHCPKCKTRYDAAHMNANAVPKCQIISKNKQPCDTILKPNVVLFGDSIHQFEEAIQAALSSDLFIVLGSSLEVTPINQIPLLVQRKGTIPMVIINLSATYYDDMFDLVIREPIGATLSSL